MSVVVLVGMTMEVVVVRMGRQMLARSVMMLKITSTRFMAAKVVARVRVTARVATDAIAAAKKAIGPAIALTLRSSPRARARVTRAKARVFQCGMARAEVVGKGPRVGARPLSPAIATIAASKATRRPNAPTRERRRSPRYPPQDRPQPKLTRS